MGIIIVFLWGLYALAIMTVVVLVAKFITPKHKVKIAIIIFGILLATYDIIITNVLGAYYCLQESDPKTLIKNKVEYPLSIYWEDNVYPGFSKEDRKLMIMNYLDGVHLKTMALNGDDGKVYVYHLNEPIWEEIKKEFNERELYTKGFDKYTQTIMQNEKIYTKPTMPKLNYTVTFDEVKLNFLASKFLYSDETKVTDNQTNETIAYNRRVMRFFYNALPDLTRGNIYYESEPVCGYRFYRGFDEEVFSKLQYMYGGEIKGKKSLNETLYLRYIKGEK